MLEVIACLTQHKNFLSVLWCDTKKERITREECSLCAGLCSKTQTQSAEPLCSSPFVFCKEQAAGSCCCSCFFWNRNTHGLHFILFFSQACKKIEYTAVSLVEYSNSYVGMCVFMIYLKVHLGVGSSAPRCCRFKRACGWSWSGRAGPVWDIWPTNSSPNSTVLCPCWLHPRNSSHR